MKRNGLVVGFLVLVFAVATGLLLLDPEPLPGALTGGGTAADGAAEPGMPAAGSANGGLAAAPEVERRPDEGEGLAQDGGIAGPTILVRAVESGSGEPVAGATVRVLDLPVADREQAERARFHPPGLDGLLAEAPTWRTDRDGSVRVPMPEGILVVDASDGERYAQGFFGIDRPVATVTLELVPDFAIRARVVDTEGRPVAGVPVALQTRASRWARNEMTRFSDAQGSVRFAHAQVGLDRTRNGEDWLAVALPGMPEAALRLDDEQDREREHLLRIPRTGSVDVRVLDYDGSPFPTPVEVRLRPREPDAANRADRPSPDELQGETRAMTEDGIARFPRVGVGIELAALARLDASERWFAVIGPGPEAPGDTAELVVRRDALSPEVRFRVVTPDGTPLAGVEISVGERQTSTRSTSERTRNVVTDADGMLRYAPRQGPLAPFTDRRLELRWLAGRSQATWTGVQDLSFDVPPGINDLGDVTLQPPRLLAAGRVTDPRGTPVDGARVRLYVPREDNRPGRVRWRMYPGGETRSDESGRFAIEGMPAGTALQLRATHPDYLQATVDGIEGGPDHQLVLGAGMRLSGRLLVDDPEMFDHLAVAFLPDGEGGAGGRREWFRGGRREEVDPDGAFDFGAMSAGLGTVQVLDRRSGLVLHETAGVAPWPADGPADGRFDPLDLRGSIDLLAISFVDLQGEPVPDVRFSITLPGGEESWWSRTRDGTAELFAPPGGLDMLVHTDGYRHERLRGLSGERRVVLVPAVPLRFDLPDAALAREFELELRFRRVEDGPDIDPNTVGLDDLGRGEASASGPGTVHVYLRVRFQDENGRRSSRYVDFGELGRRLVCEVRDSVSQQVVPLPVSREDILRAMN